MRQFKLNGFLTVAEAEWYVLSISLNAGNVQKLLMQCNLSVHSIAFDRRNAFKMLGGAIDIQVDVVVDWLKFFIKTR